VCAHYTLIIDELRIEKAHSMGISSGGLIAIEHARQFDHRLHTRTFSGIMRKIFFRS
jgi:hypothetical protein